MRRRLALSGQRGPSSLALLAFLLALLPGMAPGTLGADPRIPKQGGTVDYFTAKSNLRDAQQLENVERYHLGVDSFDKPLAAGHFGTAIKELKFVLTYVPNHPRALHLMAKVCRQSGDPYLPTRYFERALAFYPQHAYTRAQYGSYLVSIGKLRAGIRELQLAIQADSTLWVARAWLHEAESIGPHSRDDVP